MDIPFGLRCIETGESSNASSAYNSSLPGPLLIPHQTSQAQGNGRAITKEMKFTAERTIKPAARREDDRRIKVIPGFDHWSKPLPKGLRHEEIIRNYPNHLRGELLLEIIATSGLTLVDISRMSGQEQLTSNLLGERKRAAEKQRDGLPVRVKRSKKALEIATPPERATPPEPAISPEPATPFVQPSQTDIPDTFPESEKARSFLNEQEGILKVACERDPTFERRFTSRGSMSRGDRELLNWAVQEHEAREERKRMAEGNGQRTSS
ncbi:hypothetical protein MMC29_002145 [Sticta canariensis]|nr:hypothetical protein [Sticta canariensis]